MSNGMAILTTSIGSSMTFSPLTQNITTIVNNKATNVIGLNLGMNFSSYHFFSFFFIRIQRDKKPAMKGIPK